MAEFSIDRFKYNWKGDWTAGTDYVRDDVIRVNGKSYVCIVTHTASAAFRTDQNATVDGSSPPIPQPRWVVMTSGRSFVGAWATATNYNIGDITQFQGSLYVCQVAHASSDFHTDAANVDQSFSDPTNNWVLIAAGTKYLTAWAGSTSYGLNVIVKFGGIAYKSVKAHISTSTFGNDTVNWEQFYNGYEYKSTWTASTEYKVNDYVKYGASIFKCIETHTSGATELDDTTFALEFPGSQYDGVWDSTLPYNEGDIVRYGGNLFSAVNNNIDSNPSKILVADTEDSTLDWILLAQGYNFRGPWAGYDVGYQSGDIVQRGGQLFIALRDVSIGDGDGSSLDYLDEEVWTKLMPGKIFSGPWASKRIYSVSEVVIIYGTVYTCNQEHLSTENNFPGDNGSGYEYWDILVKAGQPGGLLYTGDILTYGLTRGAAGDGSSFGDTRVPIGTTGQVLSVSDELEAYWRNTATDNDILYVGRHGVDAPTYGLTLDKPFRTIRYASQYIEDNFIPLKPSKISVATGRFEEVGPITVPAGCVVMGDELRATKVIASTPKLAYAGDYVTQHLAAIQHLTTILYNVLSGVSVVPYTGNTTPQNTTVPSTTLEVVNLIVAGITDYQDYINFRVASGATDPTISGSNTLGAIPRVNAGTSIELNKQFLASEAYAYLIDTYPSATFDEAQVKQDILYYLRGVKRDIQYDGNYATCFAARYISNSVLGSQNDDLFWMRDTTGLRQMTTDGLTGTLNPPGVYAQYQRPTGGSLVALDPGWGPADNRTWIVNRSPYIQGVTNIGTACVGQKIDGALHNGGNRSMVSNDFTQVLSDGIGAWVLNNARAELVSVFTYYCQVGYLAESGGVIRATNGNNSYGSFGAIAEGANPNEVPQSCTVNNRQNEAIVSNALAGGTADQILVFEYSNTGQEYSTATSDIIGAGADAQVEFTDFRDGGLTELRLVNTTGSGSEGGSNYLIRQNSAQVTIPAADRLILNTNEETQFDTEILGMRLLIIQGTGVGQYGYVAAYDTNTKVATVRQESTSELGWDHVMPGWPIETNLDSTTTYRIEPRVTASHPGFSATYANLPQSRTFFDSAFGDLTAFYFSLGLPNGSAGVQDAVEVAAAVNVTRNGEVYIATLSNPGAGYAVGDVLTIPGTSLGGVTPANDLAITITENSADSSNTIIAFTTSGNARTGRYVAIAQPNFVVYSDDGTTWSETNLSSVRDYSRLIAGKNRFIALATGTSVYSFSYDGVAWVDRTLPASANWIDAAYGTPPGTTGRFVAVAEDNQTAAYSADGLNWTSANLPTGDDSTGDQWMGIAYGQDRYVVITGSETKDVAYSQDGITWFRYNNVLPAGNYDWLNLVYGNNRFLAFAKNGEVAYSVDRGATWQVGTSAPSIDGSTAMTWNDIKYGQGVFIAVCDTGGKEFGELIDGSPGGATVGPTNYLATSEDGIKWYPRNTIWTHYWKTIMFSNVNDNPEWIMLGDSNTTNAVAKIQTGSQAKVRADITAGSFTQIKIWDPGSGYSVSNLPTITIADAGTDALRHTSVVETVSKIGNKVLAQPDFVNRGSGYKTTTSTITIAGDGYAEIIDEGANITLSGVDPTLPGPGVQVRITGILDDTTADPDDLKLFVGVKAVDLGDDGSGNGTRNVRFQLTPTLKNEYNVQHGTAVTLSTEYSQCRISGHDFLDIGTGNFINTNYPLLYAGGAYFTSAPENEVLEVTGGRVFYVSTDQDGNFRAGELFGVNQATGVVTISAEFFDLDGLSELSLGGVRLGGSGAVVQEFSTDATFSADSNNIIPTQKAIASFLAAQLSVGGSDLETNNIQAGQVSVGSSENIITMSGGNYLNFNRPVIIQGQDANGNPSAIQGTIISQMLFHRNFNDTVQ